MLDAGRLGTCTFGTRMWARCVLLKPGVLETLRGRGWGFLGCLSVSVGKEKLSR